MNKFMETKFKLNKKNQTLTIFPISDIHVGTPLFNQEYFEYMLEKFRKKQGHKIIYLLGDLMDCATKRLGKSAYEQILTPEEQLEYIVSKLKPYSYLKFWHSIRSWFTTFRHSRNF